MPKRWFSALTYCYSIDQGPALRGEVNRPPQRGDAFRDSTPPKCHVSFMAIVHRRNCHCLWDPQTTRMPIFLTTWVYFKDHLYTNQGVVLFSGSSDRARTNSGYCINLCGYGDTRLCRLLSATKFIYGLEGPFPVGSNPARSRLLRRHIR